VSEPHQFFFDSVSSLPAPFNNSVSSVFVVPAATAFRESNLWGVRQSFRPGTYKLSLGQMATVGIGVSSILIPPGMLAELCTSESGSGCSTLDGEVNFVGTILNDNVRMIRIKAGVTVYSEVNFNVGTIGAKSKSFAAGTYVGTQFGIMQNLISSMRIDRDLQVRACYYANGNSCVVYRGDVNFVGSTMNDAGIAYMKVEPNTGT
jgi:hypothetical protein